MKEKLSTLFTLLCLIFLIIGWFGVGWAPYVSVFFGALFPISYAYESLKERNIGISLLMLVAAAGAIAIDQAIEAAILLFLYSLSGTLEEYAMGKTKSAIESLMKLRPEQATLVTAEGESKVSVHDLKIGDRIRIAAFETIPIDGIIRQGSTQVNEASMTGESIPVPKAEGDDLISGTQNLDGMCLVEVTAPVGHTALDKIVELVRDAQDNKASGEKISEWFGQRYTFFVLGAFAASFLIRYFLLNDAARPAFYASVILLVALSPCAVVISSPAATLSALAWAARNGILVRGGQIIEQLGRVSAIAIDKTGTLTAGKPKLVEICVCRAVPAGTGVSLDESSCWHGGDSITQEAGQMLRYAAAAEQYSSHPIAEAIVGAARRLRLDVPEALDQKDKPGYGVTATIENRSVKVGQMKFFEDLPAEFATHVEELQKRGFTVAILEVETEYAALGLRDEPRKDAAKVLGELRDLGLTKVSMLTGDTRQTAEVVAKDVGVETWHASLLPGEKTALIEEMEKTDRVLMVGDGINDAPSLTRATVGVAMGGLGSDIALNSADVVLMGDRLAALPELVRLGRRTNKIIWANLIFGVGMIVCLVIASLFNALPLPLAVVGHEGSTVLVILNGLRLLGGPGK